MNFTIHHVGQSSDGTWFIDFIRNDKRVTQRVYFALGTTANVTEVDGGHVVTVEVAS